MKTSAIVFLVALCVGWGFILVSIVMPEHSRALRTLRRLFPSRLGKKESAQEFTQVPGDSPSPPNTNWSPFLTRKGATGMVEGLFRQAARNKPPSIRLNSTRVRFDMVNYAVLAKAINNLYARTRVEPEQSQIIKSLQVLHQMHSIVKLRDNNDSGFVELRSYQNLSPQTRQVIRYILRTRTCPHKIHQQMLDLLKERTSHATESGARQRDF